MAGTITTVSWCAVRVRDGRAFTGSKQKILADLCDLSLVGESRVLTVKFPKFEAVKFHGYGGEYTYEEAYKDAVGFVFNRLDTWGYDVYRKILGD